MALIDWETAGPVDPLVELAQACWLNAQLHDDDIAEKHGLPSPGARAAMVRMISDGYGLERRRRARLVDLMIEVAVQDAADQARHGGVTPESQDVEPLWAVAWRVRSAAWMLTHRHVLCRALE
jgi:aminoglycoside phosphotransferase (APT) family kinase protein